MIEQLIQKNIMRPYVPAVASAKEKRIHDFLNERDIFLIDIKGFTDDFASSKSKTTP
jgi:hypothetical protein